MSTKPQPYFAFGEMVTEGIKQLALRASMRKVQDELAQQLGYSPSAIYSWRRGEHLPEPEVIEKLARIFVEGWQADQDWINNLLEKGEYGPSPAVVALNEELFGQQPSPEAMQARAGEAHQADPAIGVGPGRLDSRFFLEALKRWSDDFFRWSEASDHMRSSGAGMVLYTLSVVLGRITPRAVFMLLVAIAVWVLSTWLVGPVLRWPIEEVNPRWLAFLKYAAATLIIPLLVAAVTQPERYRDFRRDTLKRQATLWMLKFIGALAGFYGVSMVIIGVALLWYYLGGATFPITVTATLTLVPLFMSYVGARRIPADRYVMFNGEVRAHRADWYFLAVFLFVGPATAFFMHLFYQFLVNRAVAPFILLIGAIGMALWEYKKREPGATSDTMVILTLGLVIPVCLLIFAIFFPGQPAPSPGELPYLLLISIYILSETLLAATLWVRNKPTITLAGALALLGVLVTAMLVLNFNLWLGRGFVVAAILLWLLWGRQHFRGHFWIHQSAWAMQFAIGASLYLLTSTPLPLWVNILGVVLVSGLLLGWAYRNPSRSQS